MYIKIEFDSSMYAHTGYINENILIYQSFEMMLNAESVAEYFSYSHQIMDPYPDSAPLDYTQSTSGTLTGNIWINNGDTGTMDLWLHHEVIASSTNSVIPVTEPATIFLVGLGFLLLLGSSPIFSSKQKLN